MSKNRSSIIINHFLILSLTVFILLVSCNEKPTELGYSLIDDTVGMTPVSSVNLPLITGTGSKRLFIEANKGALLVGAAGDYKAVSFIRFGSIPDTLSYLKASDIISAKLSMYPLEYTFGDTTQNKLSFGIYKIIREWSYKTSWDSTFKSSDMTQSDYIDLSKKLNSFGEDGTKIPIGDSLLPITIDFDKDLVVEWLQQRNDSTRHGVAVVPDPNQSTVVRQFSTGAVAENRSLPKLTVIYTNKNSQTDTLTVTSAMDSYFANAPAPDEKSLTVEGGVNIEGNIFFDLTMIPKLANILKAELELTLDPARSKFGNTGMDSILMIQAYENLESHSTIENGYAFGYRTSGTNTYLFRNIEKPVILWVRRSGKGYAAISQYGLSDQYREIDRLVFFGSDEADINKRPKLNIIYSVRTKK